MRVQLGHSGARCPCPESGSHHFTVLDLSGVHHINIDYCGCPDISLSKVVQILRHGWFPAMFDRPQMAFTFECLSFFHELTLQGKVNMYDFYHTIMRVSDNAGLSKTVVSCFLGIKKPKFHLALSIGTQNFIASFVYGGTSQL